MLEAGDSSVSALTVGIDVPVDSLIANNNLAC